MKKTKENKAVRVEHKPAAKKTTRTKIKAVKGKTPAKKKSVSVVPEMTQLRLVELSIPFYNPANLRLGILSVPVEQASTPRQVGVLFREQPGRAAPLGTPVFPGELE
jgi:hypothetical protein